MQDAYDVAAEKRRQRARRRAEEVGPAPRNWLDAKWQERAACRGLTMDETDELFFRGSSTGGRDPELGLGGFAFCARCPVVDPCLDYALALNVEFGVYGNKTSQQRRVMRRALA